jgi:hypothetical protein
VKDLPDIALLASVRSLDGERLRAALVTTFEFRATHQLPAVLPDPPASWLTPYGEMARANELVWMTLDQLTERVGAFVNPVLAGISGSWRPDAWIWE